MPDYSAIIERLEKLSGPDREVDLILARALVPDVIVLRQRDDDTGADPYTYWEYTASVDAAIALVERMLPGWAKGVDGGPKTNIAFVDRHDYSDRMFGARYTAEAPTAAIALCLAALRALQSKEGQDAGI